MARPIWSGVLSFGLLNIPVRLMPGERKTDLHFRMLDSRDNAPIRYERVNADTGEEVPWKDIVKAFEYAKGDYVVLEDADFDAAAAEGHEAVEISAFVDAAAISPVYYEKPYVLEPGKKAEKGYVLLRETLAKTGKAGIARVVIRTREYLAAVIAENDALILMLIRYPQELVDVDDYRIPSGTSSDYRVGKRELDMARQLVESMSEPWRPDNYRDEFRDRLHDVIEKRLKSKGVVSPPEEDEEPSEHASTNVVDFMALLRKSIESSQRTPAARSAASKTTTKKKAKRAKPSKRAAKKAAKKPAKKTAARTRRKSA